MLRFILVCGVCLFALAACNSAGGEPAVPAAYRNAAPPSTNFLTEAANLEAGRELFRDHCATCHGESGRGDGLAGRTARLKPANLADPNGVARKPLSYWFWRVSEGGTAEPFHSQGSVMPAWKYHLSETERWQVIAYALSLSQGAR
jgi:mono/diheme cytochrome c family protein